MRIRMLPFALLAALVALSLAPAASPRATGTTVTVTMKEFKFTLSKSSVPAGAVTFKLVNKGAIAHDFKIGGKKSPLVAKGGTGTLTVTLKAGSQTYLCTVPGHAAGGMKGTLTVK